VTVVISLKGVDEAISNLHIRNEDSLKYRLIYAVRSYYESDNVLQSIRRINTNELIKSLWNADDDHDLIIRKRKNISSIKWSVNDELKKLYRTGNNPEGIIIGQHNTFVMCDEAKDDLLTKITHTTEGDGSVSLGQIAEALEIVNELAFNPEVMNSPGLSDDSCHLDQLRAIIRGLSQKLGIQGHAQTDDSAKTSEANGEGTDADQIQCAGTAAEAHIQADSSDPGPPDQGGMEPGGAPSGQEVRGPDAALTAGAVEEEDGLEEAGQDDAEIIDATELVEEIIVEEDQASVLLDEMEEAADPEEPANQGAVEQASGEPVEDVEASWPDEMLDASEAECELDVG
jgi:hypothetical protein